MSERRLGAPPRAMRLGVRRIAGGLGAAIALLAPLAVGAQGARLDTITVEQRILVAGDLTPAEAKRRALEGALGEAVRRVVGVRVQSGEMVVAEERRGDVRDGFVSVVQLDAAGRATDYRILEEEWVPTTHPQIGAQLYYRVRAIVTVAHDIGEPDAGFHATLALNDALFYDEGGSLEGNGELIATIASTRDGAVTVFGIVDDTVQVLLPNAVTSDASIRAEVPFEFPSAAWRAQGVHLRPRLSPAVGQRRELVAVVVTRTPVAPPRPARPGGHLTLLDLQRWIVRIPVEQRAVAFAAYEIRRR